MSPVANAGVGASAAIHAVMLMLVVYVGPPEVGLIMLMLAPAAAAMSAHHTRAVPTRTRLCI